MDRTTFELTEEMVTNQTEIGLTAITKLVLNFCEAIKETYFDESNALINTPAANYIEVLTSECLLQLIAMTIPRGLTVADRLKAVESFVKNIAELTLASWRIIETYEANEDVKN